MNGPVELWVDKKGNSSYNARDWRGNLGKLSAQVLLGFYVQYCFFSSTRKGPFWDKGEYYSSISKFMCDIGEEQLGFQWVVLVCVRRDQETEEEELRRKLYSWCPSNDLQHAIAPCSGVSFFQAPVIIYWHVPSKDFLILLTLHSVYSLYSM